MTHEPDYYMDGYKLGTVAGKADGKPGGCTAESGLAAQFNRMEADDGLAQRERAHHLEQTMFWRGFSAGYEAGFRYARHVEVAN
jgi:hypothetical protein